MLPNDPIAARPHTPRTSPRAVVAWALVFLASGCASPRTDTSDKPNVGPPPKDAKPGVMWMGVNPPTDTNSNGYADSIVSTIYLFADSGYVRSVSMPGSFRFSLLAKGGKVVREWTVANPGPQVAPIRTGVGDGYLVRVSLLDDGGSDVLPYQSAELVGSFKTADGVEVRSTPNAVLIGKAGV
jgi:hypothetical protein